MHFLIAGPYDAISGGSIYNRFMIEYFQRSDQTLEYIEVYRDNFYTPTSKEQRNFAKILLDLKGPIILDGLLLPQLGWDTLKDYSNLILLYHLPLYKDLDPDSMVYEKLRELEEIHLILFPKVIATGNLMKAFLVEKGVASSKINIVIPGAPTFDEAVKINQKEKKSVSLIMIGRISPRKNQVELIRQLPKLNFSWTLDIIASSMDSHYFEILQQLISELSLNDSIRFHLGVSESEKYVILNKSDLLIHCSEYETFGIALVEAMSRGLGIIARNGGNMKSTLGSAGILYKDSEELAEVLETVISEDRLDELKQKSKTRFEELPKWETQQKLFMDVILRFTRTPSWYFDFKWLETRTKYDQMARNEDVVDTLMAMFENENNIKILDLGAGLGNSVHHFHRLFSMSQNWSLTDHDARLISPTFQGLRKLFPDLEMADNSTRSRIAGKVEDNQIEIEYLLYDFIEDLEKYKKLNPHLIIANAFFDLFSKEQISRFIDIMPSIPIYSSLNYYKTLFSDATDDDRHFLQIYDLHMKREQEFGVAVGNEFFEFIRAGPFEIFNHGTSSWILGKDDRELIEFLCDFYESSLLGFVEDEIRLTRWVKSIRDRISSPQFTITVQHKDVLFKK